MMKLKEANAKYKSLLKMAKERIQTQAEELGDLQGIYYIAKDVTRDLLL